MPVAFTVVGHPMPAGSKRAMQHPRTGRVVVMDASRNKPWRALVTAEALEAAGEPLLGPVCCEMTFYVGRPKGHYRTGRNAHLLRESAPAHPVVRPDVLKLARAVEDSMTGIVYRDDSQIVDERIVKRYGLPERVEVRVTPL